MSKQYQVVVELDVKVFSISDREALDMAEDSDVTYDFTNDMMAQLTERQKAIVAFIKVNKYVTSTEMSRTLHVSERTIRYDIEMMPFLKHLGDRNDGYWVIEGIC